MQFQLMGLVTALLTSLGRMLLAAAVLALAPAQAQQVLFVSTSPVAAGKFQKLAEIGANVQLLDPHRLNVTGPTRWRANEVTCPPALRPGVVVLLAMLAAPGTSYLRNVYVINRGYEDLAERLNALGASVQPYRDI